MSIPAVRKALEKKLALIAPAIATAYQNVAFAPDAKDPYQRVNLLPATPIDWALTADVTELHGIFQVTLCYPVGAGPGVAEARAQLIADAFKPCQTLTEAGVKVQLTKTPQIAGGLIDGDRWCVPVSIPWRALT